MEIEQLHLHSMVSSSMIIFVYQVIIYTSIHRDDRIIKENIFAI